MMLLDDEEIQNQDLTTTTATAAGLMTDVLSQIAWHALPPFSSSNRNQSGHEDSYT